MGHAPKGIAPIVSACVENVDGRAKQHGEGNRANSSNRANSGFTMIETLLVVAMVCIMCALAFLSIFQYQKNLYQIQMDGIAKEIYIAAQNHLSTAKADGSLDVVSQGTQDTEAEDVYYYVFSGTADAQTYYGNAGNALYRMLPFGSIDDTVRLGDSYVVRYQFNGEVARVLDVFYADPDGRYPTTFSAGDYRTLVAQYRGAEGHTARQNYNGAVIGWWGDSSVNVPTLPEDSLIPPTIQVENAERLRVIVTDPNYTSAASTTNLRLEVRGVTSGAVMSIPLRSATSTGSGGATTSLVQYDFRNPGSAPSNQQYIIDLDDVTGTGYYYSGGPASSHFTDIAAYYADSLSASFIPGEDIRIQAIVGSNVVFTPDVKSASQTTNSLFNSVSDVQPSADAAATHRAAVISSMRHLENLGSAISGYNAKTLTAAEQAASSALTGQAAASGQSLTAAQLATAATGVITTQSLEVTGAVQVNDLSWNNFRYALVDSRFEETTGKLSATDQAGTTTGTALTPTEIATRCKQDDVQALYVTSKAPVRSTAAGSFMPVTPGAAALGDSAYALNYDGSSFRISDVVVRNTDTSGNAGLFGTLASGSVTNVELVNFSVAPSADGDSGAAAANTAGSLVGNATGTTFSGAFAHNDASTLVGGTGEEAGLEIAGATSTGGLIGNMAGGSITGCSASVYVRSAGDAGGLVGVASSTSIARSYSGGHTYEGEYLSDTGNTAAGRMNVQASGAAGGLVGTNTGAAIDSCYSTCSANGSTAGGLVGAANGGSVSDSYATGLIAGGGESSNGAFIGTRSGASLSDNEYLGIINYKPAASGGAATQMAAIGGETPSEGEVSAADADTETYNDFVASSADAAVSYDPVLVTRYNGTYPMKTIRQLANMGTEGASVNLFVHYGDWPSPETLVVNVM